MNSTSDYVRKLSKEAYKEMEGKQFDTLYGFLYDSFNGSTLLPPPRSKRAPQFLDLVPDQEVIRDDQGVLVRSPIEVTTKAASTTTSFSTTTTEIPEPPIIVQVDEEEETGLMSVLKEQGFDTQSTEIRLPETLNFADRLVISFCVVFILGCLMVSLCFCFGCSKRESRLLHRQELRNKHEMNLRRGGMAQPDVTHVAMENIIPVPVGANRMENSIAQSPYEPVPDNQHRWENLFLDPEVRHALTDRFSRRPRFREPNT